MCIGLYPHPAVEGGLLCAKQHHDYLHVIQCELLLYKISQAQVFFDIFQRFAVLRFLLISWQYRSSIHTQRLGGRFYDGSNNIPQGNDIFSDYQHNRCFNISIDFLFHF